MYYNTIMHEERRAFFTVVGCMDGRFQELIDSFGRLRFGALYPDTITEAGMVAHLAKDDGDPAIKELLRFELVDVSINKHQSMGIIVFGHEDCAGNPVDNSTHIDHVRKAVTYVKSLLTTALPVVGLFIQKNGERWEILEVAETVLV
jgi:hypothetical protein